MKKLIILQFLFISLCSFGQVEDDISPITPNNVSDKQLETVYITVDEQPIFPEGEEGLFNFYQKNSKYKVVRKEDEGLVVYFQIVIDETGKATRFKVLKGQSEDLDSMTQKLVNLMPNWKPGIHKEEAVRVVKNLFVKYSLTE